jgi:hypothetical protein
MSHPELHRSIRHLLLEVLDECARHMEAMPGQRQQFQPIAYAVHAALEDFEKQCGARGSENPTRDRMLLIRAQDMSLEWRQTMLEMKGESVSAQGMEILPSWNQAGREPAPNAG